MKKLLIVLALVGVSTTSMAQDSDPVLKYSVATNSFWSNWFIQVGGEWNAWYSDQEHGKKHIDRFPLLKLDQVIDWQPIEQYLNRQRTRYLRDHRGRPAYYFTR